jgi:hypothetical protein
MESSQHVIEGSQHGFTRNAELFLPRIQEVERDYDPVVDNAVLIKLPAALNADLKWDEEKARALQFVQKGALLFWQIDLGLESSPLNLKDPAHFFSYGIALEQFSREIWPAFKDQTLGISLYRGIYDILERLIWDASVEEHYQEYAADFDFSVHEETKKQFFSANLFAEFLHRLVSYLPAESAPFCLFDIQNFTNPALAACLFSRARFEYLHLALKGATLPFRGLAWENGSSFGGFIGKGRAAPILTSEILHGVVLPQDPFCTPQTLTQLNKAFTDLQAKQTPFRMVPEALLIEEWDGLDTLLVIPQAVSPSGKRMLQGFRAAGGDVCESKF